MNLLIIFNSIQFKFDALTGEADEVKELINENSSEVSERSMEESDTEKDANPTSQTASTDTKECEKSPFY